MPYKTKTVFVIQDVLTKLYYYQESYMWTKWTGLIDDAKQFDDYQDAENEITGCNEFSADNDDFNVKIEEGNYTICKIYVKENVR